MEDRRTLSINYLWFFYAVIFSLFQVLPVIISVDILPYFIYPVMASSFLLIFIKPRGDIIVKSKRYNIYLLLYTISICLSIIPFIILVRSSIITYIVSVIAFFVPFCLFSSRFNPNEFNIRVKFFIQGLYYSFIICLFIIFITGKYVDSATEGKRFFSGLLSASLIGRLSVFVILYTTLKVFDNARNFANYLVLLFGIVMLILSGSKIGIVSVLFLIFLILLIKVKKKKTYSIIIILIGLFSLLNLNDRVHDKLTFFIEYPKSNEISVRSLNGRTEIWKQVNSRVRKSVLFGYGYGSPRIVLSKVYDPSLKIDIGQSHNMYLESMLNVGLIGTLFLFLLLAKTFYNLYRYFKLSKGEDNLVYIFILLCLIYQVIRGITEASFAQASTIEVIIIFSFIIIVRNAIAIKANNTA